MAAAQVHGTILLEMQTPNEKESCGGGYELAIWKEEKGETRFQQPFLHRAMMAV